MPWPNPLRDPVEITGRGAPRPEELLTRTVTLPQKVLSLRRAEPVEMGDDGWPDSRRRFPPTSSLTVTGEEVATFAFGPPDADGESALFATPRATGTASASLIVGDVRYIQPVRVVALVNGVWEFRIGDTLALTLGFAPGDPASRDPAIVRVEDIPYPPGDIRAFRGDFFAHAVSLGETTLHAGPNSPIQDGLFRVLPAAAVAPKPVPTISPPTDVTYQQGQTVSPVTLQYSATGTHTVTMTGLPTGLTYNRSTRAYSGTVSATATAQAYRVTITVDDGYNPPVITAFTITVAAASPVSAALESQFPPFVTLQVPANRAIPGTGTVQGLAVAGDSSPTAISMTGLPTGVTYDPGSNQYGGSGQLVAASTPAGIRDITATASDGHNTVSVTAAVEIDSAGRTVARASDKVIQWSGGEVAISGETINTERGTSYGALPTITGAPTGFTVSADGTADVRRFFRVGGTAPTVTSPTDYRIVASNTQGGKGTYTLRVLPTGTFRVPKCVVRVGTNDRLGHPDWPTASFPTLTNGMTIVPLRPDIATHSTASRLTANLQAHVRGILFGGLTTVIVASTTQFLIVPVKVARANARRLTVRIGQTLTSPVANPSPLFPADPEVATVSGNSITGVGLGQTLFVGSNDTGLIVTVIPAAMTTPDPDPEPEPEPSPATELGDFAAVRPSAQTAPAQVRLRNFGVRGAPNLVVSAAATISPTTLTLVRDSSTGEAVVNLPAEAGNYTFTVTDGDDRYTGTIRSFLGTAGNFNFRAQASYPFTFALSFPTPIVSFTPTVTTVTGTTLTVLKAGQGAVRAGNGTIWVVTSWLT